MRAQAHVRPTFCNARRSRPMHCITIPPTDICKVQADVALDSSPVSMSRSGSSDGSAHDDVRSAQRQLPPATDATTMAGRHGTSQPAGTKQRCTASERIPNFCRPSTSPLLHPQDEETFHVSKLPTVQPPGGAEWSGLDKEAPAAKHFPKQPVQKLALAQSFQQRRDFVAAAVSSSPTPKKFKWTRVIDAMIEASKRRGARSASGATQTTAGSSAAGTADGAHKLAPPPARQRQIMEAATATGSSKGHQPTDKHAVVSLGEAHATAASVDRMAASGGVRTAERATRSNAISQSVGVCAPGGRSERRRQASKPSGAVQSSSSTSSPASASASASASPPSAAPAPALSSSPWPSASASVQSARAHRNHASGLSRKHKPALEAVGRISAIPLCKAGTDQLRHAQQTGPQAAMAVNVVQRSSTARAEAHALSDRVRHAHMHAPSHEVAWSNLPLVSGSKLPPAADPAASIHGARRVHVAVTASKAVSSPTSHGAQQMGSDATRRPQRIVPCAAQAASHSADESSSSSASSRASDSGSDGGKRNADIENISPPPLSSIGAPHHKGILSNGPKLSRPVQRPQVAGSGAEVSDQGFRNHETVLALAAAHVAEAKSSASSSSAPSDDSSAGESDESEVRDSEDDEGEDDAEAEFSGDPQAPSPPGAIATFFPPLPASSYCFACFAAT